VRTSFVDKDQILARQASGLLSPGDTLGFFTILFPPLLALCAQIQSACAASGQPIRFRAGPEGIEELTPMTSVLSLILPAERIDCVRGTFCQQSLFFQSEEAALP
jgi:hypothetical protein